MGKRVSGQVKFFDDQRGWGFIRADQPVEGGERELFVHYSQIRGSGHRKLEAGQRVEFDVDLDHRGRFMASKVEAIPD